MEQTGPSAPAMRAPACRQAGRIGDGQVACLPRFRAGHRQVKKGFVGPLARLLSGQGIGRGRRGAELGRSGGETQVIEDLPDLPAGR